MQDKNRTLEYGQSRSPSRVKDGREEDDRNGQQCTVPWGPGIVGNIEGNQSLNDRANQEGDTSKVNLPPNGSKPA